MARKGSRKTHHRGSRKTHRKQRGGEYYGYTGPAFSAAAGVPVESRTMDTHCGDPRAGMAPDVTSFKTVQFGGNSRRAKQRGGACGCNGLMQRGGGGGTGGFGFNLSNDLGKVYSSLSVGACPPAPRAAQVGGAAVDDLGLVSYKTGYGFGPASVVSTSSAHYLNPMGYDRTVMAGGGKRRSRRGRKHRKSSRKH